MGLQLTFGNTVRQLLTEPQFTRPKFGLLAFCAPKSSGHLHVQGLDIPTVMGRAHLPPPHGVQGVHNLKDLTLSRYRIYEASLVVQLLRILLPIQGTQVRFLVQEDPTCHPAPQLVQYNN